MLVKFKVNLGSSDAKPLELDYSRCTAGETVDCSDQAGQWLVAKGIAADVTPPKPKTVPVAPKPEAVAAVEPQETKPSKGK